MSNREKDYASLTEPMALADVARELGVSTRFVCVEIARGMLTAMPGDVIQGSEMARYLASKRKG